MGFNRSLLPRKLGSLLLSVARVLAFSSSCAEGLVWSTRGKSDSSPCSTSFVLLSRSPTTTVIVQGCLGARPLPSR